MGIWMGCDPKPDLPGDPGSQVVVTGRRIGSPGGEAAALIRTDDGHFMIIGTLNEPDPVSPLVTKTDAYVLKLTSSGDTVWTKTAGVTTPEYGTDGFVTSGGLTTLSYNVWYLQETALHLENVIERWDAGRNLIWKKTMWDTSYEFKPAFIRPMTSGGVLCVGASTLSGSGNYDVTVVALTDSGDTVSVRNLDRLGNEDVNRLIVRSGGGFLVFGSTQSVGQTPYVIALDDGGNLIWRKDYDFVSNVGAVTGCELPDGRLVWVTTIADQLFSVFAACTNVTGDTVWTRRWGGSGQDVAYDVRPATDGFIIAGATTSYGNGFTGEPDAWMIRASSSGDTLWTRTFGGELLDLATACESDGSGGWITIGATQNFGSGILFAHWDSLGNLWP